LTTRSTVVPPHSKRHRWQLHHRCSFRFIRGRTHI